MAAPQTNETFEVRTRKTGSGEPDVICREDSHVITPVDVSHHSRSFLATASMIVAGCSAGGRDATEGAERARCSSRLRIREARVPRGSHRVAPRRAQRAERQRSARAAVARSRVVPVALAALDWAVRAAQGGIQASEVSAVRAASAELQGRVRWLDRACRRRLQQERPAQRRHGQRSPDGGGSRRRPERIGSRRLDGRVRGARLCVLCFRTMVA